MAKIAEGSLRDPNRVSLFDIIAKFASHRRVESKEELARERDTVFTTPVTTFRGDNAQLWNPRALRTR